MLTKSEKGWLENRDVLQFMFNEYHIPFLQEYSLVPDLLDALEFSERVAAKLASWEQNLIIPCMETAVCERHPQDCPWCRLKYARLMVEEEMDNELA